MDDAGVGTGDVLIVDDNPGDVRFIEEALRDSQLNPTVHTVNTRDEALDFVRRRGAYADAPEPDVVLLDWNLSAATGKEVLEAAKSTDSPLPVAVMTGAKSEIESVKPSLSQADAYVVKPTDPGGYVETLRPFLLGQ